MKSVLLIGIGKFGKMVAQELEDSGTQVLAIDKNEDRVNTVLPFVTSAIIGDSTNADILSSVGVSNFDSCIVAIGDNFQSSLETTALLRELGAKRIISRACNDVHEKFLLRNGADEVIYPEKQLAKWTAVKSTQNSVLDFIEVDDEYSIFEVIVPESWHGKTIVQIDIRKKYNLNILGIKENGRTDMNITPDKLFREGQSVLVLGKHKDVLKNFKV